MKQINLALVGCGEIAQSFHLPILSNLPGIKLAAVHDKNHSKATMIAEKFDIPYVCQTVEEVMAIEEIEAVDICTPTDKHQDMALAALEAGKHVFLEKPVGRNIEEAKAVHAAAEQSGKMVMIGMNQRFRSDTLMMKNYVQMDEIGKVFYAKAGWIQKTQKRWRQQLHKSGGGVLMDLGLPIIDSLLWIFDFIPAASVETATFNNRTKDVEDVAVALIRFRDNSVATFETSWSLASESTHFYCEVYGSDGTVKINPLKLFKSSGDHYKPHGVGGIKNKYLLHQKSFESELKHFVNALHGLGPIISTTGEAVESMRILSAMYESARENRSISLD